MRICTYVNNHEKCVNKCLRVLMQLELLKTCEKRIDFSFKCFLWGLDILLTWNCFGALWLRTIRNFSFSKNSKAETKVY